MLDERPFACSAHAQVFVAVIDRLADVAEDTGHGGENAGLLHILIHHTDYLRKTIRIIFYNPVYA